MEDMESQPTSQNLFKRIFQNHFFRAALDVIAIASFIAGFFFWRASIKERELSYYISPTRIPIVQKGKLENFSVTFLGKPIEGNLSSAEIQIWNAGRESIHREHILKPITIQTQNKEPIYQVTIQSTKDINGVTYDGSSNGVVSLDWKILEQNDGVRVQIIFGGHARLPLQVDGHIEGQKQLYEAKSDKEYESSIGLIFDIAALFILIVSVAPLVKITTYFQKKYAPHWKPKQWPAWAGFLFVFIWIGLVIGISLLAKSIIYHFFVPIKPPFGF